MTAIRVLADVDLGKGRYIDTLEARFGDIPSLDGLRALSILTVLVSHLSIAGVPGGHGVFLFFIISGFLITRLLFAEQKKSGAISAKNFYARRFLRLYPVIIVYCIVVPLTYFFLNGRADIIEPLSALFYFSNYLVAYREPPRVCRRLFGLGHAASFCWSSVA